MKKFIRNTAIVLALACLIPACNSTTSSDPAPSSSGKSVQCSATTTKGERCKNMTTNSNGRCYLHQ